jgi:2-polyprenyl-3-methyl-5-hydroxy-6-metoxy-1,4-benzoquinol methylase
MSSSVSRRSSLVPDLAYDVVIWTQCSLLPTWSSAECGAWTEVAVVDPDDHTPPPQSPDSVLSSFWFRLITSALAGLAVATLTGKSYTTLAYWGTLGGTTLVGFLVFFYLRHQWFLPQAHTDLVRQDRGTLAESITSSRRSAHAISSNWLSLWRSPTFRYYLHLDAAMSLIAYSSRFASPLAMLSDKVEDRQQFLDEGKHLVAAIGGGKAPSHPYRVRLLIYPEWAYVDYTDDILQLIRSHSAARIPCIPLIAEDLYKSFEGDDHKDVREDVEKLVADLDQTGRDKLPPVSRITAWRDNRALKHSQSPAGWPPVFPDMLLIDSQFSSLQTSKVWWYSRHGRVRRWDATKPEKRESANKTFAAICRNAERALWSEYGVTALGSVAVAADTTGLGSEAFFAWPHYREWLKWIGKHAITNGSARVLDEWLEEENVQIRKFIDSYVKDQVGRAEHIELLDLGCGFGRHLIEVLVAHKAVSAVGIDINAGMVAQASRSAKRADVHRRSTFLVADVATLTECKSEEFDLAICMTNTLGNLPEEKQALLIERLKQVLRPGGMALLSVYALNSIAARRASYEAVGLSVEEQGRRIVAAEGLESEAFEPADLCALIEHNGLRVLSAPTQVTPIGWQIVAGR